MFTSLSLPNRVVNNCYVRLDEIFFNHVFFFLGVLLLSNTDKVKQTNLNNLSLYLTCCKRLEAKYI